MTRANGVHSARHRHLHGCMMRRKRRFCGARWSSRSKPAQHTSEAAMYAHVRGGMKRHKGMSTRLRAYSTPAAAGSSGCAVDPHFYLAETRYTSRRDRHPRGDASALAARERARAWLRRRPAAPPERALAHRTRQRREKTGDWTGGGPARHARGRACGACAARPPRSRSGFACLPLPRRASRTVRMRARGHADTRKKASCESVWRGGNHM